MMNKKIAIGNDHAGFELKMKLVTWLKAQGYQVKNFGTNSTYSVDYPDCVCPVARAIEQGEFHFGIHICGSAQGVAITANKYQKIRAVVCWETEIAWLARKHNDANILCLPARFISEEEANSIVLKFLQTRFEGGRHKKRLIKINSCYM